MQDLRVIGVESGALLVAAEDGTRFRIPIDEMLQSRLRQTVPDPGVGPRLSPREVQAHIRSGMSAEDVASITGAPLDYIRRFEGPVIAEREYVVQSALGVPVRTASDTDPMSQARTFGTVIRERLYDLGGTDERWASWKDSETGWVVKLAFSAGEIDHDARWHFDPKKQSLAPLNSEAVRLSQQGEVAGSLIPRLRAVAEPDRATSRFDSGAFALEPADMDLPPVGPAKADTDSERRAGENGTPSTGNQTADLLDALRRRRGERESAGFDDSDSRASHPSTGAIRVVDVPVELFRDDDEHGRAAQQRSTSPQPTARKKGRAVMPSWDEIVFGARPDDDLA